MAREKRDVWVKRVERWRDSGLTAREFAAELGIDPMALSRWGWQLRAEQHRAAEAPPTANSAPQRVELTPKPAESAPAAVMTGPDDVSEAIRRSGAYPKGTAAVLLAEWRKESVPKVALLPERELRAAFFLLIEILGVSDERRRVSSCKGECSHWWHRDLSDPAVIASILKSESAS